MATIAKLTDEELIKRLGAIFPDLDATNFDLFDFMYAKGSPIIALWYGRIFWPDFVVYDDMVLRKETVQDEAERSFVVDTLARYGGDRRATERDLNQLDLGLLFAPGGDRATEGQYLALLRRLREMWQCRLQQLFPERRFVVEVYDDSPMIDDMGLTFYQE